VLAEAESRRRVSAGLAQWGRLSVVPEASTHHGIDTTATLIVVAAERWRQPRIGQKVAA
jgi:hypothetical protein